MNWTDANNWSSLAVPTSVDNVTINNTVAGPIVINISDPTNQTIASLNDTTASFDLTGGILSLGADSSVSQAFTLSGGTLTSAGNLMLLRPDDLGLGGTISGTGSTTAQGGLTLGANDGNSYFEYLDGSTFTNAGPATWQGLGSFTQENGSTFANQAGASLDIQNDLSWNSDTTATTFNNAGTLTESAGTGTTTIYAAFNNSGSVDVQSSTLSLQGGGTQYGSFSISVGAMLGLDGSSTAFTMSSTASVSGAGTAEFGGTATSTFTTGSTYGVSGVTLVDGGTATFSAGSNVQATGDVAISSGTLDFSSGAPISLPTLTQTDGTLTGSDTVTVSGITAWTGGNMSGNGTTVASGGLQLGANDGNSHYEVLDTRTLDNAGAATWVGSSGDFYQLNGSVLNNQTGASLDIQNDLPWYSDTTATTFNNAGTLTESAGTGTTTIYAAFNNSGSVDVQSGTLSLQCGGTQSGSFSISVGATLGLDGSSTAFTMSSTASVSGAGTAEFGGSVSTTFTTGSTYGVSGGTLVDGGTLDFSTGAAVSLGALIETAGTLTGSDAVTVSGQMTWTGGTISGTGSTTAQGGLTLGANDGTNYYEYLDGSTFTNAGSATWQGLGYFYQENGSTFVNQTGASLDIQGNDLSWYSDSTATTFNNAGTLTESRGTGTTTIYAIFNNSGSVDVQSGTLSLQGGGTQSGSFSISVGATLGFDGSTTFTMSSTASVSGAGTAEFGGSATTTFTTGSTYGVSGVNLVDGGTIDFTTGGAVSLGALTETAGTLTGSDAVTISGQMTWTGGTISGTGSTTAQGGLTLGADGNSYPEYLDGSTFTNAGPATWQGLGEFYQENASTFVNQAGASLDIQNDLSWLSDGTATTFNNAGTLTESAGSGTTTIYAIFNNSGFVDVQNGTLSLQGGGTDSGSVDLQSGTLAIQNGSANPTGSNFIASQPGTTLAISGNLLGNTQNADLFSPQGTVLLDGSGTASSPQQLEVMGQDLGNVAAGFVNNFAYGTVELSNNTQVQLVDQAQNSTGTGPEALYTNNLIVPAGCTLDLNGFDLYAQAVQINGVILNGQVNQVPPGGAIAINVPTSGSINAVYPTNDWTFFGRANQAVSVVVNLGDPTNPPVPLQPNLGSAQVQILDANGNVLATGTNAQGSSDVNLLGVTLPADGTYQVLVSGQAGSTGYYSLGVYDATINNHVLSLNQQVNGQLYTAYEIDNWTFSAQANDQVQFNLLNESNAGIQFDLTGPNGYTAFSSATTSSSLITLPSNGTYVLTVQSTGGQTGAYAFNLAGTTQVPLTLGTTYQGTLQGSGQFQLFTVNVPQAGSQLLVNLADSNSIDQNELYLSLGSAPTPSSYQYRFTNLASANQQILVPSAAPGTWYILLYSDYVPAASAYSLTATSASVLLTGVTPDQDGTIQDAHLTLTGAGFNSSTTVELVASDGTPYTASAIQVNSPTQIAATFTANAVPAGTYSVEVLNADNTSGTLPGVFTMVKGGLANLVTKLILPNPMGRHVASVIYVQYSNTGDAAMPAPVLVLTGTNPEGQQGALMTLNPALQNSGFWTSAVPEGYSTSVQFLASGATPGVLQPGESEMVPVYYAGWLESQWDSGDQHLNFTLGVITDASTAAIGWNNPGLQASLQPPGMPANAWAAIYGSLTSQIGPTWGDYVEGLDQDASYLGNLGENVTDISQLWSFEVQQANGYNPLMDLSTATDMTVQIPGLPLSISRSFSSNVLERNLLGPFGYGWALAGGWGQTLAVQSDGSVDITNVYGSQSIYQPDTQYLGSYFAQPGNYNTLASPASGVFTLTAPNGQVTEFVNEKVAYIQDANGNRITPGYTNGLMTSLTDSSGAWIDFTYNSAGLIMTSTNSEGQRTTYAYDPTNQHLLSVTQYESATDTVGYTTSYIYSNSTNPVLANALLSVTNPDGSQQNFSYDAEGRLIETSANGGAQAVQYTYGIGGTVSATTPSDADGDGGTTTYYFDNRGLLLKLVNPLNNTTSYSYDSSGNLIQVTDPAGQNYAYQYDSEGNQIQSTDPLGDVTKFTYGSLDTLTSMTDPNGNITQYKYDQNGDLTSTIYADGTVEQNAFNPIGELLHSTNGDNNVANYTYNSAGQILSESYSDGTQTTFAYDQSGDLVSATNATGTTTLTYDSSNRLTEIQYPDSTYLTYAYNAAGQRLTMTDQTGYTVQYCYNTLGQLTGLSDSSGPIVSYTYDSSGQLSEEVKGNGTYTEYTYDADGDILSLINYASDGTVNSSFAYMYNDLGLNTTETTIDGQWVYTYDSLGQLTQAVFTPNNTGPDGLTCQNLQYFYDASGNRTQSITNGVVTNYTINDMNEYTSTTTVGIGTTTYQYDGNGNLISQAAPTSTTVYTYNINNQLTGIQAPDGSMSRFQYDVFGSLYTSTQGGQTTQYLVNPLGGNVVNQVTMSGGVVAEYTYGLGLVSQISAVGTASYYDFDALGSTAGLTNATDTYVNSYGYLPYGGTLGSSVTVLNPFQFVGQWGVMNVEPALDLIGARFLSTSLGSFLTSDPLGIGQPTVHSYAKNNPIDLIDPFGLMCGSRPTGELGDPSDFPNNGPDVTVPDWLVNLTNAIDDLGASTQNIGNLIKRGYSNRLRTTDWSCHPNTGSASRPYSKSTGRSPNIFRARRRHDCFGRPRGIWRIRRRR